MPSETIKLVHKDNATSTRVQVLPSPDGSDRLIEVDNALYTRTGVDGSGNKQFTWVRNTRP